MPRWRSATACARAATSAAVLGGSLCVVSGLTTGQHPARALGRGGPVFTFGVIADVQLADIPDGSNFAKTSRRCYRGALVALSNAVDWWSALHSPPAFVAQLGDLIDGQNAKLGTSEAALSAALAHLDRAPCRVVNLVGNHELYNFNRAELARRLHTAPAPAHKEFYGFAPAAGWRVLVLDAYQESIIGLEEGDPRRAAALRTLAKHNPNDLVHGDDWFRGVHGEARRFVPYNGGLGQEQLRWLRTELAAAAKADERVVVLSHVVLHPAACDGTTMAWDYHKALEAIRSSGRVVAVLCGHDHKGRYHLDESGVHHLTFCSPLNRGADGSCHGLVRIHNDRLELQGPRLDDLLPEGTAAALGAKPCKARGPAGPCERISLRYGEANATSTGGASPGE